MKLKFDDELDAYRLEELRKLHSFLTLAPLTPEEAQLGSLSELILDDTWLESKSYITSIKAVRLGITLQFSERWGDYRKYYLTRDDLPFLPVCIRHPGKRCGLYFVVAVSDFSALPESAVNVDELKEALSPN